VISTKYEVYYSALDPEKNLPMTFKVIAYTNKDNSKFIYFELTNKE